MLTDFTTAESMLTGPFGKAVDAAAAEAAAAEAPVTPPAHQPAAGAVAPHEMGALVEAEVVAAAAAVPEVEAEVAAAAAAAAVPKAPVRRRSRRGIRCATLHTRRRRIRPGMRSGRPRGRRGGPCGWPLEPCTQGRQLRQVGCVHGFLGCGAVDIECRSKQRELLGRRH